MPGPGRAKGTPNKRTKEFDELFQAACAKHNFNLVEAQVELCLHDDPDVRQRAITNLSKYAYPVRKAIEHMGADGGPAGFQLVVVRKGDNVVDPTDEEDVLS